MKKIIFMLFISILFTCALSAQTRYGFAYAYSVKAKTLYITYSIGLEKYSNCKDEYGYNSTITPERCVDRAFIKSLKIEAGSSFSDYTRKIRTSKSDVNLYPNSDDYFTSEDDVKEVIKDIIANFREKDYTVYKIQL